MKQKLDAPSMIVFAGSALLGAALFYWGGWPLFAAIGGIAMIIYGLVNAR